MRTLCVAAILAALSFPAHSADLTPSAMRALLEGQDARTALDSLDEATWTSVLAHVEAGDGEWLDVVPVMAPLTHGRAAASLALALSRAIEPNPAGVIQVMARTSYNPRDICGANDVDLGVFEAVDFIDMALIKVAAVLDPALFEARNACLFSLGKARITTLLQAAAP
jgi:hypothetical protein